MKQKFQVYLLPTRKARNGSDCQRKSLLRMERIVLLIWAVLVYNKLEQSIAGVCIAILLEETSSEIETEGRLVRLDLFPKKKLAPAK